MSYRISFVLRTCIMYINVDVVWKCGLCEDFLLCLFSHCPDQVSETQRKPKIQKLLNNMCAMVAVCWCWERIACFLYNPLSCAVHVVSLLFVFCRLRSPGFIISFCSAIPSFVILRCISLALSFPACVCSMRRMLFGCKLSRCFIYIVLCTEQIKTNIYECDTRSLLVNCF